MSRLPPRSMRHQYLRKRDKGVVAVIVALLLPVLLGFGALAVDIGYRFLIQNEMQNAADATALAAAACLYGRADCGNQNASTPDWGGAAGRGNSFASSNSVEQTDVNSVHIDYGYWNITKTNPTLLELPYAPGTNDLPAIRVTINKSDTENGGGAATFFAKIWGINAMPLSATAVAAVSYAGTAGPGALFPLVVTKCLYDSYWNAATSQPKKATSNAPLPNTTWPQTPGQPYYFRMTSSYHAGPCESGQWSSLDIDSNNVPTIRNLIFDGNSTSISIGGKVWIQPGTKTTLYSDVNACSAAGNKACEYVMVPVVEDISTHAYTPVVGMACLHILSATGGSGKYILAQMSADADKCQAKGSSGSGPNFGMYQPPRLVY
jgi:Flp pilus assembly protein TadG